MTEASVHNEKKEHATTKTGIHFITTYNVPEISLRERSNEIGECYNTISRLGVKSVSSVSSDIGSFIYEAALGGPDRCNPVTVSAAGFISGVPVLFAVFTVATLSRVLSPFPETTNVWLTEYMLCTPEPLRVTRPFVNGKFMNLLMLMYGRPVITILASKDIWDIDKGLLDTEETRVRPRNYTGDTNGVYITTYDNSKYNPPKSTVSNEVNVAVTTTEPARVVKKLVIADTSSLYSI